MARCIVDRGCHCGSGDAEGHLNGARAHCREQFFRPQRDTAQRAATPARAGVLSRALCGGSTVRTFQHGGGRDRHLCACPATWLLRTDRLDPIGKPQASDPVGRRTSVAGAALLLALGLPADRHRYRARATGRAEPRIRACVPERAAFVRRNPDRQSPRPRSAGMAPAGCARHDGRLWVRPCRIAERAAAARGARHHYPRHGLQLRASPADLSQRRPFARARKSVSAGRPERRRQEHLFQDPGRRAGAGPRNHPAERYALPARRSGNRVFALATQNPDHQWCGATLAEDITRRHRALAACSEVMPPSDALLAAMARKLGIRDLDQLLYELPLAARKRLSWLWPFSGAMPWLMLDEPTIGQDRDTRTGLAAIICHLCQLGYGTIVVTHDDDFAAGIPHQPLHIEDMTIRAV